jgi:hypothetical protein
MVFQLQTDGAQKGSVQLGTVKDGVEMAGLAYEQEHRKSSEKIERDQAFLSGGPARQGKGI